VNGNDDLQIRVSENNGEFSNGFTVNRGLIQVNLGMSNCISTVCANADIQNNEATMLKTNRFIDT